MFQRFVSRLLMSMPPPPLEDCEPSDMRDATSLGISDDDRFCHLHAMKFGRHFGRIKSSGSGSSEAQANAAREQIGFAISGAIAAHIAR